MDGSNKACLALQARTFVLFFFKRLCKNRCVNSLVVPRSGKTMYICKRVLVIKAEAARGGTGRGVSVTSGSARFSSLSSFLKHFFIFSKTCVLPGYIYVPGRVLKTKHQMLRGLQPVCFIWLIPTAWQLSFWALPEALPCMYGQDSQTVSLEKFSGSPYCTSWYLSCRKSSLKNQQLFLEFSNAIVSGSSWGKNCAIDLGFCSPSYVVVLTK